MKNLLSVVLKENLLGSPFAPTKHNSLGAAGAFMALPALFSTVVNSLQSEQNANRTVRLQEETNKLGAELQRETNQMNADLQRETNMMNQALFDKSLSWQNEMWEKTNAYNDPKAAVQRLLNAGINPYVGLGNSGNASTLGSPSANAMQSARMDAFKPSAASVPIEAGMVNTDGVYNAVSAYNQSRMATANVKETEAKTHNLDIQNEFDAKSLADRVKRLTHLAKIDEANEEFYKNQARLSTATFKADEALKLGNVKLQEQQLDIAYKSAVSMQLDIDAKMIENKWLPLLKEDQHRTFLLGLDSIKAQIGLTLANTTLTKNQALTEIQKKVGYIIDNGMKGIDYEIKKSTKQDVINTAKEELYKLEDEREMIPYDMNYRMQGKVGEYFPMPSGQYGASEIWKRNYYRNRFRSGLGYQFGGVR